MKRQFQFLLWAFLLCGAGRLAAQVPAYAWNYAAGGTWIDEVNGLAVDDSGNVFATGRFNNTVDFDPGPGVISYTVPTGNFGCFLVKIDAQGNFQWVKVLEAMSGWGLALCVDDSNDVLIAGKYAGTGDFDFGPGVYNMAAPNPSNLFVMKVDGNGGFKWARQVAGTSEEYPMAMAVAPDGSVAVSGRILGTADFDPGPGTYNLSTTGSWDAFVFKWDRNGDFVWAGSFGNAATADESEAIEFDAQGNLYGIGYTAGGVDIDMGPGVLPLPPHATDFGLAFKLSPSMNLLWVKTFLGTLDNVWVRGIAVDPWGNVGIGGSYKGTLDLDPGPGTHTVTTSTNSHNEFLLKLDPYGNFRWGFDQFTSGLYISAEDVACDASGAFYRIGLFYGTRDFDPGAGVFSMTCPGNGTNPFIAKHDSAGQFVWAASVGGTGGPNEAHALSVDASGIVWGGLMYYPADMDPGPGTVTFTGSVQGDICLNKWGTCMPATATVSETTCDSVTVNGQTYTQSGTYTQHLQSSQGCDSTLTVQVQLLRSDTTLHVAVCESYIYQGQLYTTSGSYVHVFPNAHNCDSVVTLDLVILQPSSTTLQASFCDSFMLNGQTYHLPGNYTQVLTNAAGCDSTILLQLSVSAIAASVQLQGNALVAGPAGASYQWLDCGNQMAVVPGAVAQSYGNAAGGSYACVVTQGLCTDTSACTTLVGLPGQTDLHLMPSPNPSRGQLVLDLSGTAGDAWAFAVYNALGQCLYQATLEAGQRHALDLRALGAGCYWAVLRREGQQETVRILVED